MKALLVSELPRGPEWIYELKFDGIRALAIKNRSSVALLSRAANDLSLRFPDLIDDLRHIRAAKAVLDGEVVALDDQGRPSFQLLQRFHQTRIKPPLVYFVFDALNLEGKDLIGLPLSERKEIARGLVVGLGSRVRFSGGVSGDPARLQSEVRSRGLEGLVAKQRQSRYEPGRRSGAWVKFKEGQEQEFVIGGYTEPQGGRAKFGALLVGYFQDGRLIFAGKVGTGFDEQTLAALHARFQKLVRPECPFVNLRGRSPGGDPRFTPAQLRRCTWLEPKLVCQVRFSEWTDDGSLRQPVYLGLREDKPAREVTRETAV